MPLQLTARQAFWGNPALGDSEWRSGMNAALLPLHELALPPETQQKLPLDTRREVWQDGIEMREKHFTVYGFCILFIMQICSAVTLLCNYTAQDRWYADTARHRELNAIRACIAKCDEAEMVQVHTSTAGCYCVEEGVPWWEPTVTAAERLERAKAVPR